ncbi:MAG: SDR family NAD(P)-dependent oxidoreductase, partial [Chromatiales bacterium]|nr:SDR family NAD(P)-dependent oxidoreductase [Chromatiales bacterium]
MGCSDRLAIVTGTSSGIGAALANALLTDGWTVVGLARREAGIDHPSYRHVAVDLGDLDALKRVAENDLGTLVTDNRWTRVALVNNAAISGGKQGLEDTDPDELAHLLIVNTVSPIYLMGFITGTVLPAVALRVVNISSGAAVRAFPGLGD